MFTWLQLITSPPSSSCMHRTRPSIVGKWQLPNGLGRTKTDKRGGRGEWTGQWLVIVILPASGLSAVSDHTPQQTVTQRRRAASCTGGHAEERGQDLRLPDSRNGQCQGSAAGETAQQEVRVNRTVRYMTDSLAVELQLPAGLSGQDKSCSTPGPQKVTS